MQTLLVPWPSVPANDATIVLFATHDRDAGGAGTRFRGMAGARGIIPKDIDMCEITFERHNKASAANGIRLYTRDDGGAWRESDAKSDAGVASLPVQVAALSSGAQMSYRIVTAGLRGFAVEYTAGADNPENWNGTIKLYLRTSAVQR